MKFYLDSNNDLGFGLDGNYYVAPHNDITFFGEWWDMIKKWNEVKQVETLLTHPNEVARHIVKSYLENDIDRIKLFIETVVTNANLLRRTNIHIMEKSSPNFNWEQSININADDEKGELLNKEILNSIKVPDLILRDSLRSLKSMHVKID